MAGLIKLRIDTKSGIRKLEAFRQAIIKFSNSSMAVKDTTWQKISNVISRQMREFYKEEIIGSRNLADSTVKRKTRAARNRELQVRGNDGTRKVSRDSYKGISGIPSTYGIETGFLLDKLGEQYPLGSKTYGIREVKTTSKKIKNNALEFGINLKSFRNEYPKYIADFGPKMARFAVSGGGRLSLSAGEYEFLVQSLYRDTVKAALERAFGRQFGP